MKAKAFGVLVLALFLVLTTTVGCVVDSDTDADESGDSGGSAGNGGTGGTGGIGGTGGSGTTDNTSPVSSDQSIYMSSAGRLAKSIYLAASDADLDELDFTIVSQPEHGNLSGTGAHQEYLPANSFIGTDSFTYKASDAYGESNTATVSIEVTGNDCTSDAFDGPSDSLLVHVPSHLAFEDLAGGNRVTITGNILSEAASSDPEVENRSMFVSRNDFDHAEMTTENPAREDLTSFSISFKFIPDTANETDTLVQSIANPDGSNNEGNFFVGTQSGAIVGQLGAADSHQFSNTESSLKTRSCNHFAMTIDSGTLTVYVNGEAASSVSVDTDSYPHLGDLLQFGPYAGKIWDVRLYERTLTADEVMDLGGSKCNEEMVATSPFEDYNNYLCAVYQCEWWPDNTDKTLDNYQHYIVAQDRVWERNIFEADMYARGEICSYYTHEDAGRDMQLSDGIRRGFVKNYTLGDNPLTQNNGQHWLHENFHSYQGKFKSIVGQGSGKFTLESTASWGAGHNIPGVKDSLLGHYTLHPHISLWAIQNSPVDDQYGSEFKGGHQYGANIFWSYLTNYVVSKGLMGAVFRDSINDINDLEAANQYVSDQGHDLKNVFADFAARITTWDMVEGEAYLNSEEASLSRMQRASPDAETYDNKITRTFGSEGTGASWTEMDLGYVPGSWAFNAFRVTGIAESSNYAIAVRTHSESNPDYSDFRGRAIIHNTVSGERQYYPIVITADGETSGTTVPVPAGSELYVIVATTPDTFRDWDFYNYDYAIYPTEGAVDIVDIDQPDEGVVKVVLMAGQSNMEGNNSNLEALNTLLCHANADYAYEDMVCGSTVIDTEQLSKLFLTNSDPLDQYNDRLAENSDDVEVQAVVEKLGLFLCRAGSLDSLAGETCNSQNFDLTDRIFATVSESYYSDGNDKYAYGNDAYKQMTTAMGVVQMYEDGLLTAEILGTRDDVTVLQYQGSLTDTGSLSFSQRYGLLTPNYGSKNERYGPELSFGHYRGDETYNDLLLLKVVQGGTDLRVDWKVPGCHSSTTNAWTDDEETQDSLYTALIEKAKALKNPEVLSGYFPQYAGKTIEIAGFVWFQGWNDGGNDAGESSYEANLTCLIDGLRQELGQYDLPVVIAQSHRGDPDGAIQSAQKKVSETLNNVGLSITDDLSGYFHFDSAAHLVIGQRMAEAMKAL